mmetsp:Transcript_131705/g.421389  ORF Transcript_131705/g.421389 Transcript_131705/m.421389 type:complete len:567 (+) Transcript_131705:107-1807(+)
MGGAESCTNRMYRGGGAGRSSEDAVLNAKALGLVAYPKKDKKDMGYGTAGFRAAADGLDHILFRMGILAALRSKVLCGKAVGVMVTASHNPERDNGVKLVEPMGEMLPIEWEAHATMLANAPDNALATAILQIVSALQIDLDVDGEVWIGRDTRASSARLALAVCDGAGAMQPTNIRSLGLTTTPQLHYALRCNATAGAYGKPSLLGYANKMFDSYCALVKSGPAPKNYKAKVVVDCANGIGAIALSTEVQRFKDAGLEMELRNQGEGPLNDGCGADFVKLKQCQPQGVDTTSVKGVSLDGDADRSMYFFGGAGAGFRMLDGDRQALLFAHFMATVMKTGGLEGIQVGIVQTAYANGGSTVYAQKMLGKEYVLCAKTGVKHCHHAALALDVGIYFEANGHGTILFSDTFVKWARNNSKKPGAAGKAAEQLLLFRELINEAVGDAISNMLAVEACLQLLDWSCTEWFVMYEDLPNRQIKVVVADRSAFETTNAERTCVKPEGLQAEIDKLVSAVPSGRAFVRPSGTEDVVRVYVEAATLEAMLKLGQSVVDLVYERAGGVGAKPVVA